MFTSRGARTPACRVATSGTDPYRTSRRPPPPMLLSVLPAPANPSRHPRLLALTACLAFLAAGQAFIPLLGIEDDESLFAAPLLQPRMEHYAVRIGHSRFPLMIMSYIGTLK